MQSFTQQQDQAVNNANVYTLIDKIVQKKKVAIERVKRFSIRVISTHAGKCEKALEIEILHSIFFF